jgi:hypothetical protein
MKVLLYEKDGAFTFDTSQSAVPVVLELSEGYRCGLGPSGHAMIFGSDAGVELEVEEAIRRGVARRVAG